MTRALSAFVAFFVLTASAAVSFNETAAAQPNVAGPVRPYGTQPAAPPIQPRPRAETGFGAEQNAVRYPRFKVEAVNFEAVDESGPSAGADEVFVEFATPLGQMVTSMVEDVDDGETVPFRRGQRCIFPAYDPDGTDNNRWACREEGGRGPINFEIAIFEVDYSLYPNACFDLGSDVGHFLCLDQPGDVLFHYAFSYDVATMLSRLQPGCRCFTETVSHRQGGTFGDSEYQVTIRITRVDNDGDGPVLDANPPGANGPVVHRSGSLSAQADQGFEFDGGAVVAAAASDFGFSRVSLISSQFRLTPNNGARFWLGNATPRGYATCYANRASANYVATPLIVPANGTNACYVTTDGRVGELQITSLVPAGLGGTLTLSYTTWQ